MTEPTTPLDRYLDTLASAAPTPGGGSAACLVGAMAAALCGMVARITGNGSIGPHTAGLVWEITRESDKLRAWFATAQVEDERAYGAVVLAQALPKGTESEKRARTAAVQAALAGAAAAPLAAARHAVAAMRLAERVLMLENTHLASDVQCAAEFAAATLGASAANVRINHKYLKDTALVDAQRAELEHVEAEGDALLRSLRTRTAVA